MNGGEISRSDSRDDFGEKTLEKLERVFVDSLV